MLALAVTADLNGVTDLRPLDTAETQFFYFFRVQCTACRELHPNWVSVNRFESHPMSGSRGEANFVWSCKNCKRERSASIRSSPASYPHSSPPATRNILELDCRGLEFTDFRADGDWLATGTDSGTPFTVIDLVSGEWYDYDEKVGQEVSITDIKWEIRRA